MAITNTVTLIGNMGAEARILKTEESTFAAFSLATTDSFKDNKGEWQNKETVWHNVLVFNPKLISMLKSLKKGARLEVTGSLSYRPFEVTDGEGQTITKKEAVIIARKIEQAPLPSKG